MVGATDPHGRILDFSRLEPLLFLPSSFSTVLTRLSENQDYCHKGSAALTTRQPLYPQNLVLTSPTSGGRSVGIVRSRIQATEFMFFVFLFNSTSELIRVIGHMLFLLCAD
jgi:hypothetical protein